MPNRVIHAPHRAPVAEPLSACYVSRTVAKARLEKQALARPEALAPLRNAIWRHALALGACAELGNAIRLA